MREKIMTDRSCPICGEGRLKKKSITEEFEYKGEKISIPDYVIYECHNCGESIVDNETIKRSNKLLKDFYRRVDGLLTSKEIKEIREVFGFSQDYFSEIVGGGPKAIAKYESGLVIQSRAMDNLLRILSAYPSVLNVIASVEKPIENIIEMEDWRKKKAYRDKPKRVVAYK